jgi:hypothetical protein
METIIIVSHEVKSFSLWEEAFYAGSGMRDQAGLNVLGVYRDISNENVITVISEAPSPEVAAAFTDQPELKSLWEKIGIIGDPDIRIMKKVI